MHFNGGDVVWTKRAAIIGTVYLIMFGLCLVCAGAITGSLKHATLPTPESCALLAGAMTSGLGFVFSIGTFLKSVVDFNQARAEASSRASYFDELAPDSPLFQRSRQIKTSIFLAVGAWATGMISLKYFIDQ